MSKEEFFTRIVLSYKSLLSSGTGAPCLRVFCQVYHVAYRDFLCWASTREVASGILEIERRKRRKQKMQDALTETGSCVSVEKPDTLQKHLLYPLQFIGGRQDSCVEPVIPSNPSSRQPDRIILHDIHITFPNGVMVSVGEGDAMGIRSLIHGSNLNIY